MHRYLLSYKSASTEGQWWGAYSVLAASRRKAVQMLKDSYPNVFAQVGQWMVRKASN